MLFILKVLPILSILVILTVLAQKSHQFKSSIHGSLLIVLHLDILLIVGLLFFPRIAPA